MLRRLVLSLLVLLWPLSLEATTRYMATSGGGGSNANSCAASVSASFPKLTMTGGSGALQCMSSGDTLIIRAGTYDENVDIGLIPAGGGTDATRTRIQAFTGETVWIKPSTMNSRLSVFTFASSGAAQSWIELDGINVDVSLVTSSGWVIFDGDDIGGGTPGYAHHIRIKNAEFKGAPLPTSLYASHGVLERANCGAPNGCTGTNEYTNLAIHDLGVNHLYHGMYLTSPNGVVDGCTFYNTTGGGIQIQYSTASGIVVKNSTFHDPRPTQDGGGSGHWGIIVNGPGNITLYNNVFYSLRADGNGVGIYIYTSSGGTNNIDFNTCYDSYHCFNLASGTNNFRGNIAYAATINYTDSTGGSKLTNLTDGTNPNWVDPTSPTRDFHLSATSAASIDTGTCLGTVATDKVGVARPQGVTCDRGAYEYLVAGMLPGVPAALSPANGASVPLGSIALSFTSSNATSYDFYLSQYLGIGPASFIELFDTGAPSAPDISAFFEPYAIGFTSAQKVNGRVWNSSTSIESAERAIGVLANDQWVRVRLTTFGSGYVSAALLLRLQATPQFSGYFIGVVKGFGTYRTWAYRYTNGAYTYLGSEDVTPWAANDFVEAHAVGNTIQIFRNGNTDLRLQVTDPLGAYPNGYAGLYLFASTLGQVEIDNFEAGNIGPVFQATLPSASFAVTDQIPGQTYWWKGAGRNAQGVTESVISNFSISGTAAVPVGVRLRCIHGTPNCP